MKFERNDRVIVTKGGLTGKKGIVHEVVGRDHIKVKLIGIDGLFPFMNRALAIEVTKITTLDSHHSIIPMNRWREAH